MAAAAVTATAAKSSKDGKDARRALMLDTRTDLGLYRQGEVDDSAALCEERVQGWERMIRDEKTRHFGIVNAVYAERGELRILADEGRMDEATREFLAAQADEYRGREKRRRDDKGTGEAGK